MILRSTALFLLALLLMTCGLRAEGGTCPPGYYPVNSSSLMGCAPIPGEVYREPRAPDAPRWRKRWMSVAFGTNGFGSAIDMPSKRKAEKAALAQCREMGGKECAVNMTTYNQCIAVSRGGSTALSTRAPELQQAESMAMDGCREDKENTNCVIYYSACTYPVLR
jgi:Domain of unknown function (DUF4189)